MYWNFINSEFYDNWKIYDAHNGKTKYENRIIKFAGIWKGVVVANPETNPPTHTAKYYDYKTGNEILPNYAAKFKHSLKTIIKWK